MNDKIHFRFKLLAFLMHFSACSVLFLVLSWMQATLTSISNSWLSTTFVIFCILYLAAVALRIYNGAHPGPRLLQQYFGRK